MNIPIEQAWLCADCDQVVMSEGLDGQCPICGGTGTIRLRSLLGAKADVVITSSSSPDPATTDSGTIRRSY